MMLLNFRNKNGKQTPDTSTFKRAIPHENWLTINNAAQTWLQTRPIFAGNDHRAYCCDYQAYSLYVLYHYLYYS